ncbi:uncharacterized protein EV420DRAFT_1588010 [Desarmillaria tabescens]|uniref:Uncharacterized protein n=1 Tax=Armillaria tabescens TaxID=1929756 RepID=A0AA39MJS1_ARMTA|nr:uncharacterized protein EV420DRAFT_1588010 [Desarmillaria tabescens]KAK0437461.1 hypothetical protein EV420DRAFT_1588010 [Desarmillaria tabescens]
MSDNVSLFHNYLHMIAMYIEIEYLWKQPKTTQCSIVLSEQISRIFGNICVTVLSFTHYLCGHYNLVRQALLIISQIIVCIYAVILAGVSCWSLFGQKYVDFKPSSGCHIGLDRDTYALFIYDTILFSLDALKTYKERRNRVTPDILSLILRDARYSYSCSVMGPCYLSNIITFYVARSFSVGSLSSFASWCVFMICHASKLITAQAFL